jgi:hypothetical protein
MSTSQAPAERVKVRVNVFEAVGYQYLDEIHPRLPAGGPHLSGIVRDFPGSGRDVVFLCRRLALAEALELGRRGLPTWRAGGLTGPLFLRPEVERGLRLDLDDGGDDGEPW